MAVGPLIGAAITLYALKRGDREKISASIIWIDDFDEQHGYTSEPFLHVQNRSIQPIMIAKIELTSGILIKSREKDAFPVSYEDPTDLAFPYRIDPGQTWRKMLDTDVIGRVAGKASYLPKILGLINIPFVRIRVTTMGGVRLSIDAADATKWTDRPRWLQR